MTKKALDVMGIGGDRPKMVFCSAGMPREFAKFMTEYTERIRENGQISPGIILSTLNVRDNIQ